MTGRARRSIACAVAVLALPGCAIGPDYRRPELPTPDTFRSQTLAEAASLADLPWWEVFDDEALGALIREALEYNLDLREAVARVERARYVAAVARSEFFPEIGYEGDASLGDDTTLGTLSPNTGTEDAYLAIVNAVWEIDVWGRIRRSSEAARADLLASDAFRRGVVLSLVAGVAQAYFELRELDLELEIARATVESFQETLDIFERQYRGGVASRLDALRAEAALAQTAATIPDLERLIFAKESELSVLAGRPPGDVARGATLLEQSMPPEVPAGVPSDLLARRPDLIAVEQNLVAENALVGVALSEFFPRVGLTAFAGSASSELSDLLTSGTGLWSLVGSAVGRAFTFGRNLYTYRAQRAVVEAAVARYEQVLLVALGEVADSLVAREKLADVRAEQERAVAALRESLRIARTRYLGGLASYLEVLDAQQQLFPAENDLARTRRDQLLAIVALYRTLGGGWSQQPPAPAVPLPFAP
ncbi:MAG TPA: efflux transporter outer membrane subunit [Myxococcota bacterium]|nr:efflux transporter outer membrane subunit [Myxococcota bacterium]